MTRIVAGAGRGRRLQVPPGGTTRPTADRVREALFSSLESLLGGFHGLRVLDLYAGSGALGLEALSRGAASVTLVEVDVRAVRAVRANVAGLGLPGATVVQDRAERMLARLPQLDDELGGPYDLVLADPPYALERDGLEGVLSALTSGWLAPEAVVVVERAGRGESFHWPDGLNGLRARAYGETVLWYGQAA